MPVTTDWVGGVRAGHIVEKRKKGKYRGSLKKPCCKRCQEHMENKKGMIHSKTQLQYKEVDREAENQMQEKRARHGSVVEEDSKCQVEIKIKFKKKQAKE